jgi:hypothetical protein
LHLSGQAQSWPRSSFFGSGTKSRRLPASNVSLAFVFASPGSLGFPFPPRTSATMNSNLMPGRPPQTTLNLIVGKAAPVLGAAGSISTIYPPQLPCPPCPKRRRKRQRFNYLPSPASLCATAALTAEASDGQLFSFLETPDGLPRILTGRLTGPPGQPPLKNPDVSANPSVAASTTAHDCNGLTGQMLRIRNVFTGVDGLTGKIPQAPRPPSWFDVRCSMFDVRCSPVRSYVVLFSMFDVPRL